MTDNPIKNILVLSPDGQSKWYTEDEFDKNAKFINDNFPEAQIIQADKYNPENTYDDRSYVHVTATDGQRKTYDMSDFTEKKDVLFKNFPDADYRVIRDYKTAYWDALADKQKAALEKFDNDNGALMTAIQERMPKGNQRIEPNSELAEAMTTYSDLQKQRKELLDEYLANPSVGEKYKYRAEVADGLKNKYLQAKEALMNEDADGRAEIFGDGFWGKVMQGATQDQILNPQNYFEQGNFDKAAKLEGDVAKTYLIERAVGNDGFADYMRNMGKGHKDVFTDVDFWSRGLTSIDRNLNIRGIIKRLENKGLNVAEMTEKELDDNLSPGEKALLSSFFRLAEAQSERALDKAPGYTAGQTSAESIGFMAEFLLTGGIARGVGGAMQAGEKAAASGLRKWIARELAGGTEQAIKSSVTRSMISAVTKNGTKALTGWGKFATKSVQLAATKPYSWGLRPVVAGAYHTVLHPSTYSAMAENLAQLDESGKLVDAGDAIWGGLLDQWIENWSESIGVMPEDILSLPGYGSKWLFGDAKKRLGKTSFGQWARLMQDSNFNKVVHQAGFNGLVGEMAEEWIGNGARVGLGLMDRDDFKQFASLHDQLDMAASFAPMSLFGLGGSAYAAARNAKNYKQQAEAMRGVLGRIGMSQDEISKIFDEKHTQSEIADALTPVLQKIVKNQTDSRVAYEDYKTTLRFAQAASMNEVMRTAQSVQNMNDRKAAQETISARMAGSLDEAGTDKGKFWHEGHYTGNNGQAYELDTVTTVTDSEGGQWFKMGESETTVLLKSAVDGSLKYVPINEYRQTIEDGSVKEESNVLSVYLDNVVQADRARLVEESRQQVFDKMVTDVQGELYKMGQTLTLGTKENPLQCTVVQLKGDGLIVDFGKDVEFNGQTAQIFKISYEQAANALGVEHDMRTEEEVAADEIDKEAIEQGKRKAIDGSLKGRQFTRDGKLYTFDSIWDLPYIDEETGKEMVDIYAVDSETGENTQLSMTFDDLLSQTMTEEEKRGLDDAMDDEAAAQTENNDGTPKDFRGNPLPMMKDAQGNDVVDENALWNKDTEAWLRYNDSKHSGDTQSSKGMLASVIATLTQRRTELENRLAQTTDPSLRSEIEANIANLQKDIDVYAGFLAKYDQKELGAQENAQQAAANDAGQSAQNQTEAATTNAAEQNATEQTDANTEATAEQTAEANQSVLSRIPVDEDGNPQYEQVSPLHTWDALLEQTESKEDARDVAQEMVDVRQKELDKAKKSKPEAGREPGEIIRNRKAHKAMIEELQKSVDYWKKVLSNYMSDEQIAERQKRLAEAKRNAQRMENLKKGQGAWFVKEDKALGDPISFKDHVLRTIACTGLKFVWEAKPGSPHKGLAQELGFVGSEGERKRFFPLTKTREKGGIYPAEAAENLMLGYMGEMDIDDVDKVTHGDATYALDVLLDVLNTYGGDRKAMFEAAKDLHQYTEEQSKKEERNTLISYIYHDLPDEDYRRVFDSLTDEELDELMNLPAIPEVLEYLERKAEEDAYDAEMRERENARPTDEQLAEDYLDEQDALDMPEDVFNGTAEMETSKESRRRLDSVKPVGQGVFGQIFNQFKGKAKEAFEFLANRRGGDLLGVFHHSKVGDIDAVWGDLTGGVAHIIDKHVGEGKSFATIEEAAQEINDIINNGRIDFENGDKVVFRKGDKLVTVRKNYRRNGKKIADKNWVLTAYDESAVDNRVSAVSAVNQGQAAQTTANPSDGKSTQQSSQSQEVEGNSSAQGHESDSQRKSQAVDRPHQTISEENRKAVESIGKSLGVKVVWEETMKENGNYDPKTNEIHIAMDAEHPLEFVMGHEATHRVKAISKEAYQTLLDAVERIMGKGAFADAMRDTRYVYNVVNHLKLSEDAIAEEVVADFIGQCINDRDMMQRLAARLSNTEEGKGILATLKKLFHDLMEHFRRLGMTGQELRMAELEDTINGAFTQAQRIADRQMQKPGTELTNAQGEVVADIDGQGNLRPKMSARTYWNWTDNLGVEHQGTRERIQSYLENKGMPKKQIASFLETMDYWQELNAKIADMVDENGNFKFKAFHDWSQQTPLYKKNEDKVVRAVSSLVSNGDYPLNFELTTDCIKREAFTQILNEMLKYDGRFFEKMTPARIVDIQTLEKSYGIQVACPLCFVEGKRMGIVKWAKSVTEKWNEALAEVTGGRKVTGFGFASGTFVPDSPLREETPERQRAIIREINEVGNLLSSRDGVLPEDLQRLRDNQQATDRMLQQFKDEYAAAHEGSTEGFTLTAAQEAELTKRLNADMTAAKSRMAKAMAKYPELRHRLDVRDLLGSKGLMAIRSQDGKAFSEMYSLILSANGTGTPKIVQDAQAYDGEIIDVSQSRFDKASVIGGARLFSFSDFDLTKVFDIMQIMFDCAARDAKVQSYSKEIPYILLFGKCGVKINMSMLPEARPGKEQLEAYKKAKGDKAKDRALHAIRENAGLEVDGDGRIVGMQLSSSHSVSQEFAEAIYRNPEYNRNCGAIMVGVSVNHTIWAMCQDFIRMVIPFHLSGMPIAAREKTDCVFYRDFTSYQNTGFINGKGERVKLIDGKGKSVNPKVSEDFNFYEGENEPGWDMRKRCREYLAWCEENGCVPKFEMLVNSDAYRKWCESQGYTPNQQIIDMMDARTTDGVFDEYYKVITDFTAYSPVFNGKGEKVGEELAPHRPVTADFGITEKTLGMVLGVDADGKNVNDDSMLANRERSIANADNHKKEIAYKAVEMLKGNMSLKEALNEGGTEFENNADNDIFMRQTEGGKDKQFSLRRGETALRDALNDRMRASGIDVITDAEEGQRVMDMENAGDLRMFGSHGSEEARKRREINHAIDSATALVNGKTEKEMRQKRLNQENERRRLAKEIYDSVLQLDFNDVTLQNIENYIENATPENPYGRRISQRVPQEMERSLHAGERTNAIDALYSRICESAVPANERTRPDGRRKIEAKKEECLEAWARATGHWHESVADFTNHTDKFAEGTDSDVYLSDDGETAIKVSKGKFDNKKHPTDIDQVNLFNFVFPNSAYRILGYGRVNGHFVKFLEQPFIDFAHSTPLSEDERVAYMRELGFEPQNKENTVFSNGQIVVADLQKNNIVKDSAGNISVIDADMKLHTKDVGGKYTYPPVEADTDVRDLDHIRFFRTKDGEAYGFTVDGKIYIDPRVANAETPIHEYAHLWSTALRSANAEEWKNVVDLMKGTSVWEEVRKNYPELENDDEIADEVLATYSGRRGAERLREEQRKIAEGNGGVFEKAEAISALERVKDALNRFWKAVADFLHVRYTSAEEIADRVLADLLGGVNPLKSADTSINDGKVREQFIGEKGAANLDKAEEVTTRLDNLAVAREMEDADKDAKAIKMATGWERGADGKWRYETPDDIFKHNGNALNTLESIRDNGATKSTWESELDEELEKLIDIYADIHPREKGISKEEAKKRRDRREKLNERINALMEERTRLLNTRHVSLQELIGESHPLFKAYPELKNVSVYVWNGLADAGGWHDFYNNAIVLNGENLESDGAVERTLVHEVQHWIQEKEGFELGINPKNLKQRLLSEYDAREVDAVMDKDFQNACCEDAERRLQRLKSMTEKERKSHSSEYEYSIGLLRGVPGSKYAEKDAGSSTRLTDAVLDEAIAEAQRLYAETELSAEERRLYDTVHDIERSSDDELYWRTGGEVEARNVSDRIHLSPEERRRTLAERTESVPRDRQLFPRIKRTLPSSPEMINLEDVSREDQIFLFGDGTAAAEELKYQVRNGEPISLGETFSRNKESFDKVLERAVNEKGIVLPNLNKESVEIVDVPMHKFSGTKAQKKEQAEKWARENLLTKSGEELPTMLDGTPYEISAKAIGKYLSESAIEKTGNVDIHLSVLTKLKDVIRASIEAEIHPSYLKGADGKRTANAGIDKQCLVHRLYGAVNIDGKTYRVKTTMQEFRGDNPNRPHSYEVTKIELLNTPATVGQTNSNPLGISNNSITTANLLNGVEKSYDSGKYLLDESEDLPEGQMMFSVRRRPFGGNSGYVGYSMSRRAEEAREEGRYPKTDFKKTYGVSESHLQPLVDAGIIDDSEWHHTSSYGNRTTFYGWTDESYPAIYAEHKKDVDNLVRELGKLKEEENPYKHDPFIAAHDIKRFPEYYRASQEFIKDFWADVADVRDEAEKLQRRISRLSSFGLEDETEWLRKKAEENPEDSSYRQRLQENEELLKELEQAKQRQGELGSVLAKYAEDNNLKEKEDALVRSYMTEEELAQDEENRLHDQWEKDNQARKKEIAATRRQTLSAITAIFDSASRPTAEEQEGKKYQLRKRAEAIKDMPAVPVQSHATTREQAKEQYNAIGNATNKSDNKTVTFYHGVFGKMWRGEDSLFAKIVPQLKEIYENSLYAFSEEDNLVGTERPDGTIHKEHRNIESYDYYVGKANVDGKDYYVRFTIQNDKGGNSGTHDVMVTDVRIYENPTGDAFTSTEPGGRLVSDEITDVKVAKLFGIDTNEESNNSDNAIADKRTSYSLRATSHASANGTEESDGVNDEVRYSLRDIDEQNDDLHQMFDGGMQSVMGDSETTDLLMDAFAALPDSIRKSITIEALKNGGDFAKATADYFSGKDFDSLTNADKACLTKLREAFRQKADIEDAPISFRDMQWLLYSTTHQGIDRSDPMAVADWTAAALRTGHTEQDAEAERLAREAEEKKELADEAAASAADAYNGAASYWLNRLHETWVDMYDSVNRLIEILEKVTGSKAKSFEDVRLALNQQSSKGLAAMTRYTHDFLEPMWDAISDVMKKAGVSYKDVVRYVMLKHALERNSVFAKRDATAFYKDILDKELEKINGSKESDAEKTRLADEAKAEYDKHIQDIEDGTDAKYLEMRENDYGGMTSMFSEYPGLRKKRKKETDAAYNRLARKHRKPMFDNVADMEAEAQKEVDEFESKASTDELWKRINAATKETLESQYRSNILTKEQFDRVANEFKYYVPLRGFSDTTGEDIWSYYNASHSGDFAPVVIGAKGRRTEAANPFNWIGTMASTAIASNVKNETKLALYYFAANRSNQSLLMVRDAWMVLDEDATRDYQTEHPGSTKKIFTLAVPPVAKEGLNEAAARANYDAWEKDMEEKAKNGEAYRMTNKMNVSRDVIFVQPKQQSEHLIRVKVNGRDQFLIINGSPRAAQAINGLLNMDNTNSQGLLTKGLTKFLRWLSAVCTSYNPEFWISNLQRDLLFSGMSMSIEGDGAMAQYRNIISPKQLMKLAKDYEENTLGSSEIERYYKEFAESGAITGFTVVNGNDYWESRISKHIAPDKFYSGIKDKAVKCFEWMQQLGESVEQMNRFAAYVNARKNGKDIAEAVSAAKEISVNFNRKGSGKAIAWEELGQLTKKDGSELNTAEKIAVGIAGAMPAVGRRFIMFFNAAIQGLNAMYRLAKSDPAKFGKWMAGYFAIGALNALLHAMTDDDDDEYLDIPEFTRRNNLLVGYGGLYFKWALPQESRVFYALGDMIVNRSLAREPHINPVKEVWDMVTDVMPLGGGEGIQALMPSAAQPIMDIILNRNFAGAPIHNSNKFLSDAEKERRPRYKSAYKGTGAVFVDISKALNSASGGNRDDAGGINVYPEDIKHVFESLGGGTLTTINKFFDTAEALLSGETPEVRRIPFLNRVLINNDERTRNSYVNELYNWYQGEAEHTGYKIKEYRKFKDAENTHLLNELKKSKEYMVYKVYETHKKRINDLQKDIREEEDPKEKKRLIQKQDELKRGMIEEISNLK